MMMILIKNKCLRCSKLLSTANIFCECKINLKCYSFHKKYAYQAETLVVPCPNWRNKRKPMIWWNFSFFLFRASSYLWRKYGIHSVAAVFASIGWGLLKRPRSCQYNTLAMETNLEVIDLSTGFREQVGPLIISSLLKFHSGTVLTFASFSFLSRWVTKTSTNQ